MGAHRSIDVRFHEKYVVNANGCWIWNASFDSRGYGKIAIGKGKSDRAHRISWSLHKAPLQSGECVLHKCDTPACVNPDHLFIGDRRDNNIDKAKKARALKKLSPGDHEKIRSAEGTHAEIAKTFCISRSMVTHIKNGTQGRYS